MLCRSKTALLAAWVAASGMAAAPALAQPAAQVAMIQSGSAPSARPAAVSGVSGDPAAQLLAAARDWVMREQGVPADLVQVATVDPRVQVRACEGSFAFDLPFSTAETVRVRCSSPVWQVFVRASVGRPVPVADRSAAWAPVSAAGASSPTGVPSARPATVPGSAMQSGTPANAAVAPAATPPQADLRPVLVAAGPLQRGETLDASDVKLVQMPANQLGGRVIAQLSEVTHTELLRDLPAGTPIRPSDIRPILLVKKGQMVTLSINGENRFVISAQLEAMQDGKLGEQIKLKNPESGRIVSGVVQGPNAVLGGSRGL
ncbi:MAG: flagella basal body P-ring formation protein FlgA [Betaproteobacteria bacterium]|jgi:flagellar basal body P-ring formation protein FlgA|nr:flagella basal body P-ring formation protein FlgA [Betaproteobacteria bacterium]NBS47947.1 flagella basal body P-ring formation protein FlgA [Betaproteobacteria bacterium]